MCQVVAYGACDQFWVVVDPAVIAYRTTLCGLNDYDNLTKTIRHELGHTTGLDHGSTVPLCVVPPGDDAMVSGVVPSSLIYYSYDAHHRGHINGAY